MISWLIMIVACFTVAWLLFLVYKMFQPMWGGGQNQARANDPSSWRLEMTEYGDGRTVWNCVKSDLISYNVDLHVSSEREAIVAFDNYVEEHVRRNFNKSVIKTKVVK